MIYTTNRMTSTSSQGAKHYNSEKYSATELFWQYSPKALFGMVIQPCFPYVILHFKTPSKTVIWITFSAAESGHSEYLQHKIVI
jgi:hypothetical protein